MFFVRGYFIWLRVISYFFFVMNYIVGLFYYFLFVYFIIVYVIYFNVNKKNFKGIFRYLFENYMVVKNLVRKKKE